jgi:thiol-disulfide isomerase/thioredoxin
MPNTTARRRGASSARPRGRPRWALALLAALAAAALAWSVYANEEGGPPDFRMVAYDGPSVEGGVERSFSELVGAGTPVVLNFWAASCPPCREEMPGFQRVHDEFGGAFAMVGVDIGPFVGLGTREGARAFLDEYGIAYPTYYATDPQVIRDYEVRGMPTTVFLDGDGAIVDKHTGFLPDAQFRSRVRTLIDGG